MANRASGSGAGLQLVHRLVRELNGLGFATRIAWTISERQQLVAEAKRETGCRCLVAVGGDGTVTALVNERPQVPITILPAGTENLAARHFGLRRNPRLLARIIADGRVIRTDVGCCNGRRFLLMAGFGFDGDVVTRHHRSRTSRSGALKTTNRVAYVEPILRASLFYRFPRLSVKVADHGAEETLQGTTVFVFNLPRYALGLPFAPDARQDDGLLHLVVFRKPGPFTALYYLWKVLRKAHLDHPGVFHRRARKIIISSELDVPVQVDGDPGGFLGPSWKNDPVSTHSAGPAGNLNAPAPGGGWTIEALPGAVDVLVPSVTASSRSRVPLVRTGVLG